jgi:tellurite resistance protein
MLKLEPTTIARLRNRLKAAGERPSVVLTDLSVLTAGGGEEVPPEVLARFDGLCEAMFLMASADGSLEEAEIDTVRGALRELSDGTVRSTHVVAMVRGAQQRIAAEGRQARIKAVGAHLKQDVDTAESAFVCAAAVAFADDEIEESENEVLNELADALGIDGERAEALLDEMQGDSETA